MKILIRALHNYTRKNSRSRRVLEWLCDHTGGHEQSNDIGYSGGAMIDVWCKHCDAMYQVPKTEKDIPEIFKHFMQDFDEDMRGLPID